MDRKKLSETKIARCPKFIGAFMKFVSDQIAVIAPGSELPPERDVLDAQIVCKEKTLIIKRAGEMVVTRKAIKTFCQWFELAMGSGKITLSTPVRFLINTDLTYGPNKSVQVVRLTNKDFALFGAEKWRWILGTGLVQTLTSANSFDFVHFFLKLGE